ncbi:hypothetical protein [Roseibium algae]|uniref:Uncharacterized protein n=1 Tax=Roseibium algae TaxID=3123038 RepID=A0ABU8TFF5_9HYPH
MASMGNGADTRADERAEQAKPHERERQQVDARARAEQGQEMRGEEKDNVNGNMHTARHDASSISSSSESNDKKAKRIAALMLKLHKLDAEIAALEKHIADLVKQRDQLLDEARQEEAQAGDLDELIKAAEQDGMSDDERRRLKAKLGEKANGKTDAELLELARQERDRLNNSADDKRRRAEVLEGEIDAEREKLDDLQAEREGVRQELGLNGVEVQAQDRTLMDTVREARDREAAQVGQYAAEGYGDAESEEVASRSNEARNEGIIPEDTEIEEFMQQLGRFDGIRDDGQRQKMQLAIVQRYPELAEDAAKTDPAVAELVELANAETESPATVAEASPSEEEPTQTASVDGGWSISGGMG